MDIRIYAMSGSYDRKIDEFVKSTISNCRFDIDLNLVRERYSPEQKQKLDNIGRLAVQMINQEFSFFNSDCTNFSGVIQDFNWNDSKTVGIFHLKLDNEPDADIEYSVNKDSVLLVEGDEVLIKDEGLAGLLDQSIAANSFKVYL